MSEITSEKSLEILLIDDHALFAEGLATVLSSQPEGLGVTVCTSGEAAIRRYQELEPGTAIPFDVILLDLDLPDISGSDLITSLRSRDIRIPIIVISGTNREDEVQRALDTGACGFVPKSSGSKIVVAAIQAALKGDTYLPEEYWSRLNPYGSESNKLARDPSRHEMISARQREVLALLERGYSNARIASILDISVATVKTHLVALFRILNSNNRTECIRIARERRLLD